MKQIYFTLFIILLVVAAWAHPGGLDDDGGHFDAKTGHYHYHRGTHAGAAMSNYTPTAITPVMPPPVIQRDLTSMGIKLTAQGEELEKLRQRVAVLEFRLTRFEDRIKALEAK